MGRGVIRFAHRFFSTQIAQILGMTRFARCFWDYLAEGFASLMDVFGTQIPQIETDFAFRSTDLADGSQILEI